MIWNAQYANSNAQYGQIMLGSWFPDLKPYGAWPQSVPADNPMLNWQEPVKAPEIDANIAIIRKLKAQLEEEQNTQIRIHLRAELQAARDAKVAAFKHAAHLARIEDDEESFIILN